MREAVTGVEQIPCKGFLQHMLANGALVYQSQGGRYCAGAVWHWGSNRWVIKIPLQNQAAPHFYARLPSVWGSMDGGHTFSLFCGKAP